MSKTVSGTTTKYCYDGAQVIAEYEGGTLVRKFVYGPGIDEPIAMIAVDGETETWYYYHFDGLGSVAALSDEDGDVVESYSYDVFGEPSASSSIGNPYMFTGRRWDEETGLYYYRARMYSAVLGRFLQPDPIGYAGGLNLHAYCGNNPVNWIDPWGLDVWIAKHGFGGWHGNINVGQPDGDYVSYSYAQAEYFRSASFMKQFKRWINPIGREGVWYRDSRKGGSIKDCFKTTPEEDKEIIGLLDATVGSRAGYSLSSQCHSVTSLMYETLRDLYGPPEPNIDTWNRWDNPFLPPVVRPQLGPMGSGW